MDLRDEMELDASVRHELVKVLLPRVGRGKTEVSHKSLRCVIFVGIHV